MLKPARLTAFWTSKGVSLEQSPTHHQQAMRATRQPITHHRLLQEHVDLIDMEPLLDETILHRPVSAREPYPLIQLYDSPSR